jgi:DNA-binding NarL/FixJ family response regulator
MGKDLQSNEGLEKHLQAMYEALYQSDDLSTALATYFTSDSVVHHRDSTYNQEQNSVRLKAIKERYSDVDIAVEEAVILFTDTAVSLIRLQAYDNYNSYPAYFQFAVSYVFKDKLIHEMTILTAENSELFYAEEGVSKTERLDHIRKNYRNSLEWFNTTNNYKVDFSDSELLVLVYFIHGYKTNEIAPLLNITAKEIEKLLKKIKSNYDCQTNLELRSKLFMVNKGEII